MRGGRRHFSFASTVSHIESNQCIYNAQRNDELWKLYLPGPATFVQRHSSLFMNLSAEECERIVRLLVLCYKGRPTSQWW